MFADCLLYSVGLAMSLAADSQMTELNLLTPRVAFRMLQFRKELRLLLKCQALQERGRFVKNPGHSMRNLEDLVFEILTVNNS